MKHWTHLLPTEQNYHEPRFKFRFVFCSIFSEQMLWLLLQVAPIRNERDLVVLLLLTFRDITAFKQLIDAEDTKSGMIFIRNLPITNNVGHFEKKHYE